MALTLFFHSAQHVGEACAGVLDVAFDDRRLQRITACMDARYTASARLAARLGMRPEALPTEK